MKKILSLILALALVLSMAGAACADDGELMKMTALGRQRGVITFEETQKLHAWEVLCDMFAQNGLTVEYTVVERDQYASILNANLMDANSIPDFFWASPLSDADVINLIESGMLLDINEALQYSKGPAAKEFAEDGLYYENVRMNTYTDGGLYVIGQISKQISVENDYFGPQAVIGNNCALLIRQDWLDALNLPMPTTTDELIEALVAFQENDMNGNGVKDERMAIDIDSFHNGVAQWFGLAPFDYQVNRQAHTAVVPALQEGYVEYVKFLQKCIDAGVLLLGDDVSYYNGGTSGSNGLNTMMQDDCVSMYYGVALADHAYQSEDAVYSMIPAIQGAEGIDPVMNASSGYKVWGRWAFSAKADPKAVAAFLDTICTQEYAKWVTFGIEDETYTVDPETGYYTFTASNKAEDILATGLARGYMLVIDSMLPDASQIGWYQAYNGPLNWNSYEELLASPYFVDKMSNEYTENQIKNFKVWCEDAGKLLLYNFNNDVGMIAPINTLDEADVLDMYNTDLSTYLGELTVNFLNGNYNIDNYEDYVAELEGLGLREVLAVRQAQYDRYYGAAD